MEKHESQIRSFFFLCVAIAYLTLASPSTAYADGKYYPERAYKVPPAIPSQRAILAFKSGEEKLTIESALDGQGHSFGWVIPLPARPTEFEEVSPGLIKTLSLNLQPEITHDLRGVLVPLAVFAVVVTLGSISAISKKPAKGIVRLLIILLGIAFFVGLFMPALGPVGVQFVKTDQGRGVTVHEVSDVGSYQLSVLDAVNADSLNKWLEDSGFVGLTADEKPVITEYIRDGFCFVAAKLRREGEGYSRPHPVAMTFPCKAPIYPMRLTGTIGSDVYLELFVVAERKAHCQELRVEVSDILEFHEAVVWPLRDQDPLPSFVGGTYHQYIGHPDAAGHLWDGCVLTKLAGVLQPDEMSQDLSLQLKDGEPHREHFYSHAGALQEASIVFLVIWCGFLPVSIVVLSRKIGAAPRKAAIGIRLFTAAAVLSVIVSSATYLFLPKVSVKTLDGPRLPARLMDYVVRNRMLKDKQNIAQRHDYFKDKSREQVATAMEDYFASQKYQNPYTGQTIEQEDSPGNYTIVEDERGVVCRTYSLSGYPDDLVLTVPPQD
jgi:hypothetical protein